MKSEIRYYVKRINNPRPFQDEIFMRMVALTQAPDGTYGVTEWLEGQDDGAKTYWHETSQSAAWDVAWWHESNTKHGFEFVGTLYKDNQNAAHSN